MPRKEDGMLFEVHPAPLKDREGRWQSAVGYMSAHQHGPNANNLWQYF